jgi:23S rRNA pseudouridine2604 synthase
MIKPQKPARAAPASPSRPSRQAAQPAAPAEQAGERLSKRVAFVMRCSRREAEQYIEGGWVKVDGRVVEEPMARVADQAVVVDPNASLMGLTEVTLLLHKPAGLDTMALPGQANKHVKPAHALLQAATHTAQDESGNRVLKRHFAKLTACVPLETGASGLVVFTQDWRVLRKLTEDAAVMEHEVLVEVKGDVPPETLQRLNTPPASVKDTLPAVKVSVNSTSETSTRLRFAFKGIHPGLIAYLCERLDLHILSMKRLRVGRVTLAHLPEGQWRYLQAHERF